MSKGYTIQYFIRTLTNATTTQVTNNGVYNTVSPRYGYFSVKASALDNFIGNAAEVASGAGRFRNFGKTPRARVLKALRLRKAGKL